MSLLVVGFNHTTTPIALRERLAVPLDELRSSLSSLVRDVGLEEAMLLSTCNRTELYGVHTEGGATEEAASALARMRGVDFSTVRSHAFTRHQGQAARHIFRVAASLESIVIGEPQILGQVKEAYQAARDAGTLGSVLDRCMTMAFHGAKRVRSETLLSRGAASVASVSVDLARSIFGDSASQRVLLVGAGEMCRQAGLHLRASGADSTTVVNRSGERGGRLAREVQGTYRPWTELRDALVEADVVVSGTGAAGHVLDVELVKQVMRARRGAPLFIVDMAVPRDVAPAVARLSQVYLYNVDDLQEIVRDNMSARVGEVEKAEA
ncbi:MAG: glutamyl-tRNA reductase, partial [Nannocystaceae bacterium]